MSIPKFKFLTPTASSLINNENNIGDSVSPCLTPDVSLNQSLDKLFNKILDLLSSYIFFIELYKLPSIPYSSKRKSKRSLFTRSKAFSMSRKAANVGWFSCNRFWITLDKVNIWSEQDLFLRNPFCSSTSILHILVYDTILLLSIDNYNLPTQDKRLIPL